MDLIVNEADIGVSNNFGDTLRLSPWGQVTLTDSALVRANMNLLAGKIQNRGRFVMSVSYPGAFGTNQLTAASYICRLDSFQNGLVPSYYRVPSTRFVGSTTGIASITWRVGLTNLTSYVDLIVAGVLRFAPYPTDASNDTVVVHFLPGTVTEVTSPALTIYGTTSAGLEMYHQGTWNSRAGSAVTFGWQQQTARSFYQLFQHTGIINMEAGSLLKLTSSHYVLDGPVNNAGGELEFSERCPVSAFCNVTNNVCTCWLQPYLTLNASQIRGYGTLSLGRNVLLNSLNLNGWTILIKQVAFAYNSTLVGEFTNCNVTLFSNIYNANLALMPTAPATFDNLTLGADYPGARPTSRLAFCFSLSLKH